MIVPTLLLTSMLADAEISCAAASIHALATLSGYECGLDECARRLPVQKDGVAVADLVREASRIGMTLSPVYIGKSPSVFPARPVIAVLSANKTQAPGHFVVLNPIGKPPVQAQVIDPFSYCRVVGISEWRKTAQFSGWILVESRYWSLEKDLPVVLGVLGALGLTIFLAFLAQDFRAILRAKRQQPHT